MDDFSETQENDIRFHFIDEKGALIENLKYGQRKTLAYISASAPIADATYKKELDSATNIRKNFENPALKEGEII